MKMNNFRGDLTDNSAKKEALAATPRYCATQTTRLLAAEELVRFWKNIFTFVKIV